MADYFGSIFKEPFEFHSSQEGIQFLHNVISKVSDNHSSENILLAMEATGHYYKRPAAYIHQLGYDNLFVLNPVSTAQCRKAGLTWSKTDDIDLMAIGQALLSGYASIYRPETPFWEDLRELCRYRRFQVKHQTALKNKIHTVLDNLLPGITALEMFKDPHLWHPASLEFFSKYPSIESISRLSSHYIVKYFSRRGRRLSSENAHSFIRWTKQTFNQDFPANPTRAEILKSLLVELKQLSENISQVEVRLLGNLVQTPAVLLLSIDYIGPIRAGEFAGEITPFEQYPNSRTLIKGAGLDPTRNQSVDRESKNHQISKKGSKNLRYISINIGDALMKRNNYFISFANRLMERGKSKDCACVATATRFIRVAFHMIKNNKTFQPPNQQGISKNPLDKIRKFLIERHASDKIEEYVNLAKIYFDQSLPKEAD
ncbi:MAG: Transposase [Candidatus Scalindua rubra]|uniref:Transposase n=1 Tax=Candidatus Scalindua rubra TaxID=1872076 RepID=A0A1E3X2V1_9BACT|nr:MAG: Transposase [Candidatus Scalindua rubra]